MDKFPLIQIDGIGHILARIVLQGYFLAQALLTIPWSQLTCTLDFFIENKKF
jgi:hypothetical protein